MVSSHIKISYKICHVSVFYFLLFSLLLPLACYSFQIAINIPFIGRQRICYLSWFDCENNFCIPENWACDGMIDCKGGRDEAYSVCVNQIDNICRHNEHNCGNVTEARSDSCISNDFLCDGIVHCEDKSDELHKLCEGQICPELQFACDNFTCIPGVWQCDKTEDCHNGVDELNCTFVCKEDEFKCLNNHCIPDTYQCDLVPDCTDGSDEFNCSGSACNELTHFMCGDGVCVLRINVCDGIEQCPDGSDEKNCSLAKYVHRPFFCPNNRSLRCFDGSNCILQDWLCDSIKDCSDGSDESAPRCSTFPCVSDLFNCRIIDECIPKTKICDGIPDCFDGTDESVCGESTSESVESGSMPESQCSYQQFTCVEDNTCVGMGQVCNKIKSCLNASDEYNCSYKSCNDGYNGNCEHYCHPMPNNQRRCYCMNGYILDYTVNMVANATRCLDINECTEKINTCAQRCRNLDGSFECGCDPGYMVEFHNRRHCKAIDSNISLILSDWVDIRLVSLQDSKRLQTINQSTIVLDHIYETNQIVWWNPTSRTIELGYLNGSSYVRTLVTDVVCRSLAVDWIGKYLYYTHQQESNSEIRVVKLLGGRLLNRTLMQLYDQTVLALRVDPLTGWMFWSVDDSGRKSASICRVSMDGTSYHEVIVSTHIKRPLGLSLDLHAQRVFWADAALERIESCDYSGALRLLLLSSSKSVAFPSKINHPYNEGFTDRFIQSLEDKYRLILKPFMIDTFERYMYWTDMESRYIMFADKFTGNLMRHLEIPSAAFISIFHSARQPKKHVFCSSPAGNCTHFCIPDIYGGYTCVCANGYQLADDGVTCMQIIISNKFSISQSRKMFSGNNYSLLIASSIVATIILALILLVVVYRYFGFRGFKRMNWQHEKYDANDISTNDKFISFSSQNGITLDFNNRSVRLSPTQKELISS